MNQLKFLALLDESRVYLDKKKAESEQEFGLSKFDRMEYEQETGRMIFSSGGNRKRVVAGYQIVGSLSGKSNTWLWSWDNPYLLENTFEDIWQVKKFGEENGIENLTHSKWEATKKEAWDMAAIAANLLNAKGADSFSSGDILVFVVFTQIKTDDGV